jgi:hypothetical protein
MVSRWIGEPLFGRICKAYSDTEQFIWHLKPPEALRYDCIQNTILKSEINRSAMEGHPSGRAVSGVGLRPLACWDLSFETHQRHGCLSLVIVVLSGRGLCDGLITRPEETYRVSCVWVWSWNLDNDEALAHWGLLSHWQRKYEGCTFPPHNKHNEYLLQGSKFSAV